MIWPNVGLAVVLMITVGIYFDKKQLTEEAFTSIETIKAQDWGFSSLTRVFKISRPEGATAEEARSHLGKSLIKELPVWAVTKLPEIITSKLRGFPDRPKLSSIQLDIDFESYQTILNNRSLALKDDILSEANEVPAKATFDGKTVSATIRLKGDMKEHWRAPIRMSFRVKLKGDRYLNGFNRFSIQRPGSRQFPHDQVFQDLVRKAGGLSAPTDYVKTTVNGQKWGIMLIEEHMSKELLEKQKAKESLIIKLGNEKDWVYERQVDNSYTPYHISNPKLFSSVYGGTRYFQNPMYRALYSYVVEKFQTEAYDEIVDVESYARTAILASVWNSDHTLLNRNCRHYLNPYTLKLEPISTDQVNLSPILEGTSILSKIDQLFGFAIFCESGKARFNEFKGAALESTDTFDAIVEKHQSIFPSDESLDFSVFNENREFISNLKLSDLKQGSNILPEAEFTAPPSSSQLQAMPSFVHVRHYDDGRLQFYNLLPVPVTLDQISHTNRTLDVASQTIPASKEKLNYIEIDSGIMGVKDGEFLVQTSVNGIPKKDASGYTLTSSIRNPLTTTTPLPPFFSKTESGWAIASGRWEIEEKLLVEGDLQIGKGTTLIFSSNSYLIVKGSLTAEGTRSQPIILEPMDESWKGLYVLEARKRSLLNHVRIHRTTALTDGLLTLTGGITFYRSPVDLKNCEFLTTSAEDALNLVKSNFRLENVSFENSVSDALDIDFSDGVLSKSSFVGIQGDAADFSGSTVEISELYSKGVRDKAISAGEGSTLLIHDSTLTESGVGIAAKDGSHVDAERITFDSIELYSAMAYVKKPMFGSSSLTISNSPDNTTVSGMRQLGSFLSIEGVEVQESSIDVEALYQTEVMSKER